MPRVERDLPREQELPDGQEVIQSVPEQSEGEEEVDGEQLTGRLA